MTFVDFKKLLLDADISLPKFAKLIKVSEKNIQAYKKKEEVPNHMAVIAKCFAHMKSCDIDYKKIIDELNLTKKKKDGVGFQIKPSNSKSSKEK